MAIYRTSSRYKLINGGILADRNKPEAVKYYQYVAKDGDNFELLASKILGDGKRYWEIADINPQVKWPNGITVGTVLRIPA